MGWECCACKYKNLSEGTKKCLICETPRERKQSTSSSFEANDTKPSTPKKRTASSQRTLFSGTVPLKEEQTTKKAKVAAKEETKPSNTSTTSRDRYKAIEIEPYEVRAKKCLDVMKTVFQIEKLRKLQPKAVECALKGQSQIVVMATGGGKSLCYQLPAVVLGGVTIVISPLIALMRDQVDALIKKGVAAACINSSNKESENNEFLDRLIGKKWHSKTPTTSHLSPLNLVYVTPESLQTSKFQNILMELEKQKRLSFFAVDEAHAISSWGHDFRRSYRKLDWLATSFPNVPRMALTATATPKVIADIQQVLKLEDAPCHVGSFDRPNIMYKVHMKDGLDGIKPGGALEDLAKFISKQHKRAKKVGTPCSGIVYVHKRDDCLQLAAEITRRTGIKAAGYHGGMKDADRTRIQREWISGEVQIAIATVALGMGIDLGHVRYVVHWAIPKTMDGFYQESGRAGRDGLPAISLVYFSREDARLFAFLNQKQEENRKSKGDLGSLKRQQEALQKVVDYCVTPHCRRQFVLQHFGEKNTCPKTVCQKSCDYCLDPQRIERAIQGADSMRAMAMQQKNLAKHKEKSKEWDGQWSAPHGTDDLYLENEDWEVDGLGVTGPAKQETKFVGSASFVSVRTLKSKLDSLEAMEMQENQSDGFYQFKSTKPRDPFPEHFRKQLQNMPVSTNTAKSQPKSEDRSSAEIAASAEKIKAELAAIEAQRQALLAKKKAASK